MTTKKKGPQQPSMEDLADRSIHRTVVMSDLSDHPGWKQTSKPKPKLGTRHDSGKVKLDLIPPELEEGIARMMEEGLRVDLVPLEAIRALASVLTFGAKKYEPRNWERGLKYRCTYAATRRHLLAWRKGEKIDADSKLPALYGALFGVAALITFEERGLQGLNDFQETIDE